MEDLNHRIDLRGELLRKGIHLLSISIPVFYYYNTFELTILLLLLAVLFMVALDIGRKVNGTINGLYISVLGKVLRYHEIDITKHFLSGGTYFIIGIFLSVLLFPKQIGIASVSVLVICDTFAALIGKHFGKIKIGNKTLEGSIGFFISGLITLMIVPRISQNPLELYIACSALFVATVVELIPSKIDDNISIPLIFGLTYTILNKLILNI